MPGFLTVPWAGQPRNAASENLGKSSKIGIYSSYRHAEDLQKAQIPQVAKSKPYEDVVSDWVAGKQTIGDCPLWKSQVFDIGQNILNRIEMSSCLTPTQSHEWYESATSAFDSGTSHYSGALGVGVGNDYFGASVMGKYDRTINNTSNLCCKSVSIKCVDSLFQLSKHPPFSRKAKTLLGDLGPIAFQAVFGTHFVAGLLLGAEAGYCFGKQADTHNEKDTMSAVVEAHFLFWSSTLETKVTEKLSNNEFQNMSLTFYDTLSLGFIQGTTTAMSEGQLVDARTHMTDLEGRIKTARSNLTTHAVLECDSTAIVGLLLAPWQILPDWHEGIKKWRDRR